MYEKPRLWIVQERSFVALPFRHGVPTGRSVAFREAAGCSVEAYWPLLMARETQLMSVSGNVNMGQFGDRTNGVAGYLA